MGMFGLKLRTNIPCADVIKILRQFDPDASISNLRFKIIHNDFVYVCDCIDEDGIITLLNLLHEVEAKSIIFWLNSYDSEYEMKDLITYEEAVNEVIYFLQNDDVSANLSWEPD